MDSGNMMLSEHTQPASNALVEMSKTVRWASVRYLCEPHSFLCRLFPYAFHIDAKLPSICKPSKKLKLDNSHLCLGSLCSNQIVFLPHQSREHAHAETFWERSLAPCLAPSLVSWAATTHPRRVMHHLLLGVILWEQKQLAKHLAPNQQTLWSIKCEGCNGRSVSFKIDSASAYASWGSHFLT